MKSTVVLLLSVLSPVFCFSIPPGTSDRIKNIALFSSSTTDVKASIPEEKELPWQRLLSSLPSLSSLLSNDNDQQKEQKQRVIELKQKLLTKCRKYYGKNNAEIRQEMEALIGELSLLNPTAQPALNPLLQRTWILEWTTEKEINFFLQNKFSTRILQNLSYQDGAATDDDNAVSTNKLGNTLENYIPFVKGGGFGVKGTTRPADASESNQLLRTKFLFQSATLDLGRWGSYSFPPVGEGWFDTIYLDQELRIDTNSRDDILICTGEKQE